MRAKAGILLIIGLLLIVGTVAADPLTLSISTTKPWVTANGADSATINVHVTNTSSGTALQGATLAFSVDNPVYGYIQGASVATTSASGDAGATFATNTKSGVAVIRVNAQYMDNGHLLTTVSTFNQNINHDIVQHAVYSYSPQATVGTITHLNITLTDRWGNPIDDKNPGDNHQVFLDMNTDGGAGFQPGSVGRIGPMPIDNAGNVSLDLMVSTTAERNYFQMEPVGNLGASDLMPQYIDGLAEQNPSSLSQTIPSPNALPADGAPANTFGIFYTVFDRYGNPINNTPVTTVSSDTNIPYTSFTNPNGMVYVSFGPKDIIGYYTLSASANANASAVCQYPVNVGSCSQVVQYYNTAPVDLSLTANPLAMTSLDVDPTASSIIQAKVTDIKGNPVTGELVRFSLGIPSYPGGPYYNITAGPSLSALMANVSGGAATVTFYPGAFANYTDPGYNGTSTGQDLLTASWFNNQTGTTINRTTTLVWKNYPYLSSFATAACTNAKVGDNINLTIQLVGNGAAMRPKPIDAELIMDVSGSMGQTPTMNGPLGSQYKIAYSKLAGQSFVTQMDPTKDQVGLVTFSQSASVPYSLGNNFAAVNTAISGMSASGNTNTRTALKMAIQDVIVKRNPNPKSIQAIILLTDGAYNYDGDPLARKTGSYIQTSEFSGSDGDMDWYKFSTLSAAEQNLAYYAKENNIRIYTVTLGVDAEIQPGYANTTGTWQIYNTFDLISSQTGGIHYAATDGSQLVNVYAAIAQQLNQYAGGNTQVALDFGQINLNDQLASNVTDYMAYVPDVHVPAWTTDSTYVDKINQTPSGSVNQLYNYSRDDSSNWTNKMLNFNVGTINLNETWSTTFRLNLTQAGNIELFPPDHPSFLTFTDASTNTTTTSPLPPITCNVQQGYVDQGYGGKYLSVDNLSFAGSNPDPSIWTIQWNTTYTGNLTAQEYIQYRQVGDSQWNTVGSKSKTNTYQSTDQFTLDTSSWEPNVDYEIQISATASDANYSNVIISATKNGPTATNYIKLE